jgi:hypothetical protein
MDFNEEKIMKVSVISYSLTGNNDKLAEALASSLTAPYVRIIDVGQRSNWRIAGDMLFKRTPRISPETVDPTGSDLLLFVGPVWMGQPASPFRTIFKSLKSRMIPYAFVSISGGALGPHPKLGAGLEKMTGRKPEAVMDLQIAKLFLKDTKPNSKNTSAYQLTDKDVTLLKDMVMEEIGDLFKS